MSKTENPGEAEKALARVEQETGLTRDQQMEQLRMLDSFANKQVDFAREMAGRASDLAIKREETKMHLMDAAMADRQSRRDYNLANRQLDMLEKVLTHHFAERKLQIEGGFRMIDQALEEGNWDAATKVFGDMSAMVAKSPLAAAIELNNKMKSGKAITLDDF